MEVSNSSIPDHPFPFYCAHLVRPKQTIVFFFGGGRGGIFAIPPSPLFSKVHLVMISFSRKKSLLSLLSLRSPKKSGDENLEVNYSLVSGRFGALKQNLMLRARQGQDYSNFQHFLSCSWVG